MGTDWTSIRVREATLKRLQQEVQHLLRCYTAGLIQLPNAAEGYSLDALVNRLLDRVERHRARGRAQRARRKGRGKAHR